MKRYQYLELCWSGSGIALLCADPQLVSWVVALIQQHIPSCVVARADNEFPAGTPQRHVLKQLGGKDLAVGYWLLNQLCSSGWEPFAVSTRANSGTTSETIYHLKAEMEPQRT